MADSDSDGDSSRVKLKTQRTLSEECKTASEKHLEEFLFGGADNVIEDLGENNNEEWNFQSTRKRRDTQEEPVKRAPAWKDEDDECNTEM